MNYNKVVIFGADIMKKILLFLTSLFIMTCAFSQSADFITKMLATEKATFGQVCYLSAVCQGLVNEKASETDSFNAIFEQGVITENNKPEDFVTYKQAAAIFSKIWKIDGGLFFRLTKGNARYAYKQLKNDNIIPGNADPSMIPAGTDILNMFTLGDKKYKTTEQGGTL